MGTSKRRLNEQIKKLLMDTGKQDINKALPQATSVVLTDKRISKELENDSFRVLITAGLSGLKGIKEEGGYGGFSFEDIKSNKLTMQEFIEKILDLVDAEYQDDLSEILLQAFRMAMASTIIDDKDVNEFVTEFCFYVVFLIIQHEIIEALSDIYLEISHEQINQLIKDQARKIVSDELRNSIFEYVEQKITLKQLVSAIVNKASDIEFGEF